MIMVSVCLPSDALSQHLHSYLGFSYLGHVVSLHSCSSKAQPLLLTLDEVTPPDLEHGVGPRDALKKDSRGLSRGAAGNPRFPRILTGTLGNFPGCL